jgi:hypothetical protein
MAVPILEVRVVMGTPIAEAAVVLVALLLGMVMLVGWYIPRMLTPEAVVAVLAVLVVLVM